MTNEPGGIDPDKQEIKFALDILRKRWQLKTNWQVIHRLIETVDKTVLQLAERKARIKQPKADTDGQPDP